MNTKYLRSKPKHINEPTCKVIPLTKIGNTSIINMHLLKDKIMVLDQIYSFANEKSVFMVKL